ncbi:MAG: tRNA (adenosine(37)-N6)-dimethylallyltransferase MiaA [Turneriella sp.]|nr:tRNA (adenosine(37)-N6)-dimethylallyltransferase MiaA [Turneriella sp.]
MALPKLLILTGVTASGKSSFLYEELRSWPLYVINADSRQVYRELRIASAAPQPAEIELFPHALYGFLSWRENFSAGAFVNLAKHKIAKALAGQRIPVICGGSYFYIHALLYGLLPEVEILPQIQSQVNTLSADEAYRELKRVDPVAAARVHPHNAVRIRRQLMLCLAHGAPISNLKRSGGVSAEYDILQLEFNPDKAQLEKQVRRRTMAMFEGGLVEEADAVLRAVGEAGVDWQRFPALTGIGIREFFEHYAASRRLPKALSNAERSMLQEKIVRNTLRLAKKQRTWLRNAKPKPIHTKTVDPSRGVNHITALVRNFFQI